MNARSWFLFAAVSVLWGVPYLFIGIALRDGLGPITTAAGRVVVAAIVLLPIALSRGARQVVRHHPGRLAILTLVEVVVPFSMIPLGELTVSSSVSGIIIATEPIFILLFTLAVTRKLSSGVVGLLGVALGFAGVVVLLGFDGSSIAGAGLLLIAAASYALGAVLVGRWFSDVPPLRVVSPMILLAAPVLVVLAVLTDAPPSPTWAAVGAVVTLGVACTAGGFWTFFALIGRAGASTAGLITYVAPIVAVAAGVLVLDESVGVRTLLGVVLIFVGALLATRRTARDRVPADAARPAEH